MHGHDNVVWLALVILTSQVVIVVAVGVILRVVLATVVIRVVVTLVAVGFKSCEFPVFFVCRSLDHNF